MKNPYTHFNKKNSTRRGMSVGAGLGVGLLGALALAVRFGWRNPLRQQIPDTISPAVFATRMLNTSGGEIVYHTSGKGAPLLFLHGIFPGASSFEWSYIYPHFAPQYHVVVPDLIGFGESQRPRPAISAEAHARALAHFFHRTINDQPLTIIASGLSAHLALLLNAYYPNKIGRIILWMPTLAMNKISLLTRYPYSSWLPGLARMAYRRQCCTEQNITQWLLRSGFPATAEEKLKEVATVLTSTAQQYGAEHAFLAQSSPAFWRKVRPQLNSTTTPITLLLAQNSDQLSESDFTSLRSFANHLAITEIETASPLAPLADPEPVMEALRFLI